MPAVVGVSFKQPGRHYWFAPGDLEVDINTRVVVETARGVEIGTVRTPVREIPAEDLSGPLKAVVRIATSEDEARWRRNAERAQAALETAAQRVRHHKLPMKLLSAEFTFDCSQITISFTAESRVDFRELVKDLAGRLHTRVQLYQIGARDHTRMLGGYGPCGREFCCRSFLADFAPVSMRMAKDQSLFLNPVKFSGVCGKLMCCLRYEHETYTEAKTRLPAVGSRVATPRGAGRVVAISVIRDEVTVALDGSEAEVILSASDIEARTCPRRGGDARGGSR